MKTWIVAGLILLVAAIVFMISGTYGAFAEGFATVDFNTAQAQRQQLQFEGERRYNDFARLQSTETSLNPDQVNAAFQQAIPAATSTSSSLLSLLSATNFGAADDGTNKQGLGVEQTGMVQSKINFCEGITQVNCDLLDDPRLAECGFCHRDGMSSKGKPHRGGMFISADDQIRANETAEGGKGVYKPTFGTCLPQNFTMVKTSCEVRELQMQCQKSGAPDTSNPCGQCFGSAPAGSTGLLYVGPKDRTYSAILHVSHPGGHTGLRIVYGNGYSVPLISTSGTRDPVLEPMQVTLNIQEGMPLTIIVQGVPVVWCGWLSNLEGTRTVSLDIGAQRITPEGGFAIAGDKFAGVVKKAMSKSPGWAEFQQTVPNSVLWYQRRDEVVNGMITRAWYGNSPNTTDASRGVDVTDYVKLAAGANQDIPVSNEYFKNDPDPNIPKNLYITRDNGDTLVVPEGQTVGKTSIQNTMGMEMIVPATLVEPLFQEDKYYCPSGPLVFTAQGAGIMGANSCFTAEGKFNPSLVCVQRLFQAAGGSTKGTLYPKTKEAAAALAQKDETTGEPSLDATMNYFNTLGNIAIYGVDMSGAPKDFDTVKAAALQILGVTMNNPCDGPNAKTGPHNPECLDYLWRTSGDPSKDALQMDPTKLGYAYCTKEGKAAPLNPDGSVNQANTEAANEQGAIPNIRAYFQGFFNRSQDSSSFDAQAAAMRSCYGVMMTPPVEDPAACPRKNPDEWQCMGPKQLQQPEVFHVGSAYNTKQSDAEAVCATYGARTATRTELNMAQSQGAEWCSAGWVSDSATVAPYPMQAKRDGCGAGAGIQEYGVGWLPSSDGSKDHEKGAGNSATAMATVNCFGKKPPAGTQDISPFNGAQWYNPMSLPPGISDSSIILGAEMQNTLLCGGPSTGQCAVFKSDTECNDYLKNKGAIPAGTNVRPLNPLLNERMAQYFAGSV